MSPAPAARTAAVKRAETLRTHRKFQHVLDLLMPSANNNEYDVLIEIGRAYEGLKTSLDCEKAVALLTRAIAIKADENTDERRHQTGKERFVTDNADTEHFQAEHGACRWCAEDRGKPATDASHKQHAPVDSRQARQSSELVSQRGAHLQRGPLASRGAAKEVAANRANEDQRRRAQRYHITRIALMSRLFPASTLPPKR